MSLLSKIKTGKIGRAQKVVITAPEGFGKSTMASRFPNPVFFDIEGSTAQLDVARLGRADLPDLNTFESALAEVIKSRQFGSIVIDTFDWLEDLIADDVVAAKKEAKITCIEDFGYGKGWVALKDRTTILLARLDEAITAGIHVVCLAHTQVKKFEPPDGAGAYDRYTMKLSKHVSPLLTEWADCVLFGNYRTQIAEKDKNESGQKFKGVGGRERLLHTTRCAAWDAKNRHGMADVEKWDIAVIEKAFRQAGAPWGEVVAAVAEVLPPVKPVTAPAPVEAKPEPVKEVPEPAEKPLGPPDDDQIPGLPVLPEFPVGTAEPKPVAPTPDELDTICQPHGKAVIAYLLANNKIGAGQDWRSVTPDFRARVLKNPAGFLKVVKGDSK